MKKYLKYLIPAISLCAIVACCIFVANNNFVQNQDDQSPTDAVASAPSTTKDAPKEVNSEQDLPKTSQEVYTANYNLQNISPEKVLSNGFDVVTHENASPQNIIKPQVNAANVNSTEINYDELIMLGQTEQNQAAMHVRNLKFSDVDNTLYYFLTPYDHILHISKYEYHRRDTFKETTEDDGWKYTYTAFSTSSTAPWVTDTFWNPVIYGAKIDDVISPANTMGWFGSIHESGKLLKLSNIKSVNGLSNLNMTNVTDASYMFAGAYQLSLSELPSNLSNVVNAYAMFSYAGVSDTIVSNAIASATSVTNWGFAFSDCTGISIANLSSLKTDKVVNLSGMFVRVNSLGSVSGLSGRTFSTVTTTASMFYGCSALSSVDCGGLISSTTTSISGMFAYTGITSMDVSDWDTSGLTSSYSVFSGCTNLTQIKGTEKLIPANGGTINSMFEGTGITEIDVSSWDMSQITDVSNLFKNCTNLTTIRAASGTDWSSLSITSTDMFLGCISLEGGRGTTYNKNFTDKTYARIDILDGDHGYFTEPVKHIPLFDTYAGTTYRYYPIFKSSDANKWKFYIQEFDGTPLTITCMADLNDYISSDLYVDCCDGTPCTAIRYEYQSFKDAFGDNDPGIMNNYIGGLDYFNTKYGTNVETCENLKWKPEDAGSDNPPCLGDVSWAGTGGVVDSYSALQLNVWSCVRYTTDYAIYWDYYNAQWARTYAMTYITGYIVFSRNFGGTPPEPEPEWAPMQVSVAAESDPIDFYPAFSSASEIAGYKFAVKNGADYTEISVSSIQDIATALSDTSISDSTTLYYFKTDPNASSLKSYTVRDSSWSDVFETPADESEATSCKSSFLTNYGGLETAELSSNCSGWNGSVEESDTPMPYVNSISFADYMNQYYPLFENKSSNLLFPWGSFYNGLGKAFLYDWYIDGIWSCDTADDEIGCIVLEKEFGAPPTRYALFDTDQSGNTVRYFPVFNGNADDYGYKFYQQASGGDAISGITNMDSLKDYYSSDLWVSVEEGKGIQNSGKCVAVRVVQQSYNDATNTSSGSSFTATSYQGGLDVQHGGVSYDHWCALDWAPETSSSSLPTPYINYSDGAINLNTNVSVNSFVTPQMSWFVPNYGNWGFCSCKADANNAYVWFSAVTWVAGPVSRAGYTYQLFSRAFGGTPPEPPKEIKPLSGTDPQGNTIKYLPVFPDNNPPANVTFYSDLAGTQVISNVTTMADLVDAVAYSAENGASVNVVRVITNSFNNVYINSSTLDIPCTINPDWLDANVLNDEEFYNITDTTNPPAVFDVLVSDMYAAYTFNRSYLISSTIGKRSPFCPYAYNLSSLTWNANNGCPCTANVTLIVSRILQ